MVDNYRDLLLIFGEVGAGSPPNLPSVQDTHQWTTEQLQQLTWVGSNCCRQPALVITLHYHSCPSPSLKTGGLINFFLHLRKMQF